MEERREERRELKAVGTREGEERGELSSVIQSLRCC